MSGEKEYRCEICGRKISKDYYEDYEGICWECWDDQFTEESEDIRRHHVGRGVPPVLFLIIKIEDCTILNCETCYTRHNRSTEW